MGTERDEVPHLERIGAVMTSASDLGVTAASSVAQTFLLGTNYVFASTKNAPFIGGLSADTSDLSVTGQLTTQVSTNIYKFNFEQGSALKLAFNNETNTSTVRTQILDSNGNVVADNFGTAAQQQAYTDITSSSGLTADTGTYYVKVGYYSPTDPNNTSQAYDFQLYSGSTYSDSIITTTLTQSYDPNLFTSATSSVTAASNVTDYDKTSLLSQTPSIANATDVGDLTQNVSELTVVSGLTSAVPAAYYSFNNTVTGAIKFNLNNTTSNADLQITPRVQLYDSSGNIIADSQGTSDQVAAYQAFNSGAGLYQTAGKYYVKVSYPPGSDTSIAQNYNLQLFAGNGYNSLYQTTAYVAKSGTSSTDGLDVGVFTNYNALKFSRSAYHTIGEKPANGVNIGWISENLSSLQVSSQLTKDDNSESYSLTLQQGDNLKLTATNQTNTANLRIKIYDASGLRVLADNHGTAAQQQAYNDLISSNGLAAAPGAYNVNVSYAPNTNNKTTQTYSLQFFSGNTFTKEYQTTASAQTYGNAVLTGNPSVVGYSSSLAAASYLKSSFETYNGDGTLAKDASASNAISGVLLANV